MRCLGRLALSALTLVLVATLTVACGRDQPPVAGATTFAPADRVTVPELAGTTLDGDQLDLADLRGQVVVLNAWASWCEPCRAEVPALVDLSATAEPDDIAVVGLDVSDDEDAARAFQQDFAMPYPSVVDPQGALLASLPGVPPRAVPTTLVVDRQGRIATRIIGQADSVELARLANAVAAE